MALWLAMLLAASPARPPAFELHALGVLGGDTDTNLSCFMLGEPGGAPVLMIDAGSVAPGMQRWLEKRGRLAADASPTTRALAVEQALRPLRALLLTHAHLDHWGGFVDQTTLDFALAMQGRPSLQVIGLPQTLDAIRDHVFRGPLWADFTNLPAKNPAVALHPLEPGARVEVGPFSVELVPVNHTVPGAAFLIHRGDAAYLHLGDTGPTEAVWALARPLLKARRLRGIALEMSYPAREEKLAAITKHLARNSFLLELAKLVGIAAPKPAVQMTDADAVGLAKEMAPSFASCPIVVIHVKALGYDEVAREVAALRAAGLPLLLPEQGGSYLL